MFWKPETVAWVFVIPWLTAGTVFFAGTFWKEEVSNSLRSSDKTHIKDPKNIFEAQPPGHDLLFTFLRVEAPRDPIPFIPLGEVLLNICHGPAIESNMMDGSGYVCWFNSHRQLIHSTVHGLTNLVRRLSICPSVKHAADIDAE